MAISRKSESSGLFIGDIIVFFVSLWLTLFFRTLSVPTEDVLFSHLVPFSILFAVWALIFFIAGLYDRHTLLIKSKLPGRVLSAHVFNLAIASIFFYVIPYFGVTPKTTLFLYLFVSTILIFLWRFFLYPRITEQVINNIVVIAKGKDVNDLVDKLRSSSHTMVAITDVIDPSSLSANPDPVAFVNGILEKDKSRIIALDLLDADIKTHISSLYGLIFEGVQFIDIQDLYEDIMDKVPLGLINESWFLEHVSIEPNFIYDSLKRLMDIVIALPLGIISLFFYPFVWVAIKIEDKGPIYIYQNRVGQNENPVHIVKFRSMTVSDEGKWVEKKDPRVTKTGSFIRKSRIDELPQLWNILRGDISLIGPRPELPRLVELYKKEIPHYNVRHLIKPGISGWAQIHHEKPPHSIEETVDKLAYDLYYIKHRSFMLDLKIALQTVKTLLSRVGV